MRWALLYASLLDSNKYLCPLSPQTGKSKSLSCRRAGSCMLSSFQSSRESAGFNNTRRGVGRNLSRSLYAVLNSGVSLRPKADYPADCRSDIDFNGFTGLLTRESRTSTVSPNGNAVMRRFSAINQTRGQRVKFSISNTSNESAIVNRYQHNKNQRKYREAAESLKTAFR